LLAKFDVETTAWNVAALMGNAEILEKLWEWAKETHTHTHTHAHKTEKLNKNLLLATDQKERTALHVVTLWNRIEVLEKLWEFAEEGTTVEVNKMLLLATDYYGVTAQNIAVFCRHNYLFEQLWELAKEKLTTDE
jgi:ankyrin repeat protein